MNHQEFCMWLQGFMTGDQTIAADTKKLILDKIPSESLQLNSSQHKFGPAIAGMGGPGLHVPRSFAIGGLVPENVMALVGEVPSELPCGAVVYGEQTQYAIRSRGAPLP